MSKLPPYACHRPDTRVALQINTTPDESTHRCPRKCNKLLSLGGVSHFLFSIPSRLGLAVARRRGVAAVKHNQVLLPFLKSTNGVHYRPLRNQVQVHQRIQGIGTRPQPYAPNNSRLLSTALHRVGKKGHIGILRRKTCVRAYLSSALNRGSISG